MYFPRRIQNELLSHLNERQITVITGMRRTGKTTLLKWLFDRVNTQNKIFVDFERMDNRALFSEANYDNIIKALILQGLNTNQKLFLFLDEIQLVKNLPSVIKYLYDKYEIKFVVTGSSSYYLKNMFTESLAGRKKIFNLTTLDFLEFLTFKGVHAESQPFPFSSFFSNEFDRLKFYYNEYIEYGGFPEVALQESAEKKIDILNDIVNSYIYVDLQTLADIRNIDNLNRLLKLLAKRIGSKLIINKIASLTKITRITINNYIKLLENTFFISRVSVYSKNPERDITKAKKLYFCDNGIITVLGNASSGYKFENAIFNQLSKFGTLQYYSQKNGKEIDFILNGVAFEVKESPDMFDLKKLSRLANKIEIKEYKLIGRYRVENFSDYIWGGTIR